MNSSNGNQVFNAYSQNSVNTGTPRSIEHQAFQRITMMLSAARKEDTPIEKKAEAIYLNSKLWVTLATDLFSPQNKLPTELRAQLISLAEFSRKHGLKVLSNEAKIDDLIEINTAIMRGLRGPGKAAEETLAPSPNAVEAASTGAGDAAAV